MANAPHAFFVSFISPQVQSNFDPWCSFKNQEYKVHQSVFEPLRINVRQFFLSPSVPHCVSFCVIPFFWISHFRFVRILAKCFDANLGICPFRTTWIFSTVLKTILSCFCIFAFCILPLFSFTVFPLPFHFPNYSKQEFKKMLQIFFLSPLQWSLPPNLAHTMCGRGLVCGLWLAVWSAAYCPGSWQTFLQH